LKGQKFGRLTILQDSERSKSGHIIWVCKCDCGNITEVRITELRSGGTRSCGCFQREAARTAMVIFNYKHGEWHSRLNRIWMSMKQRCSNPLTINYKYYGAKGISVCDEWEKSFVNFRNWALANGYQDGLTIDRIDNDGDYSPQNCQWLSRSENAKKQWRERSLESGVNLVGKVPDEILPINKK